MALHLVAYYSQIDLGSRNTNPRMLELPAVPDEIAIVRNGHVVLPHDM